MLRTFFISFANGNEASFPTYPPSASVSSSIYCFINLSCISAPLKNETRGMGMALLVLSSTMSDVTEVTASNVKLPRS